MAIKQPIHIGLGNVDNTSDANKPVSIATQNALNLKANIASPILTGTPEAPTATAGTKTTQLATTEFVANAIAPVTPTTLTGVATIGIAQTNVGIGADNTELTLPLLSSTVLGTIYIIKNFNYTSATYTANTADEIDGNAAAAIILAPQASVFLQAYSAATWATL